MYIWIENFERGVRRICGTILRYSFVISSSKMCGQSSNNYPSVYISIDLSITIYIVQLEGNSNLVKLSLYIYIYIYIYIYLLIYYLPAFTVTRKKEKNLPGTRDKNISNHRPGEKRKNIIEQKKKKRKDLLRHTSWKKSRDMQSVGQKKNKTHCKRCNVTITRVLNTSGANYKINLNRESEFSC